MLLLLSQFSNDIVYNLIKCKGLVELFIFDVDEVYFIKFLWRNIFEKGFGLFLDDGFMKFLS